jgi:16S rRNA (uracil1498-N3)-methyltransferase
MVRCYSKEFMKTTPRLHVDSQLAAGQTVALGREQTHYLVNVLRLGSGDPIRPFNERDGEWLAHLGAVNKKQAVLVCQRRVAEATPPPDIEFLFAPLKHARLDYAVQKATELGARRLRPIITHRTVAGRVNLDRMRANAIEAAEQCNLVHVPDVREPQKLSTVLAAWPAERRLIYCDEAAPVADPVAALSGLKPPAALLVGPEGGFTDEEKQTLRTLPFVTAISLGPRVIRADTAAVAALALVQAVIGDWKDGGLAGSIAAP